MKSIPELEQIVEKWDGGIHPRKAPGSLSEEEWKAARDSGIDNFDITRLKCYYGGLEEQTANQIDLEAMQVALGSPSEESEVIIYNIWSKLRGNDKGRENMTQALMRLFNFPDRDPGIPFEDIRDEIPLQLVDYGLRAYTNCMGLHTPRHEYCSCYLALLSNKKLAQHNVVKDYPEQELYKRLFKLSFDQLFKAVGSEDSLLFLLDSVNSGLSTGLLGCNFSDPDHFAQNYCETVENYVGLFARDRDYYSRYITFSQSSGYGKTHLSRDLSQKFFVVYTCLRKPKVFGIPSPSAITDYFSTIKSENHFLAFYRSLFQQLYWHLSDTKIDRLIKSLPLGKSDKDPGNEFQTNFEIRHENESTGIHQQFSLELMDDESIGRGFWCGVEEATKLLVKTYGMEGMTVDWVQAIEQIYWKLYERLAPRQLFRSFVFVIDHARCLVDDDASTFLNWRKAMSKIRASAAFFFILLDTSAELANVPVVMSARGRSSVTRNAGYKLFPPHYFIPSINKVKLKEESPLRQVRFEAIIDCKDSTKYASFLYSPLVVLEKSRPVFLSCYYECEPSSWKSLYSSVIFSAQRKLTGKAMFYNPWTMAESEKSPSSRSDNNDATLLQFAMSYMAATCCRVPLMPVDPTTNNVLVSDYMSTILNIDETGKMTSYYVPETILQEAAANFLWNAQRFEASLQYLRDHLRNGQFAFGSGNSGLYKVIVSVCLLRAYDCLIPAQMNEVGSDMFITPRTTHAFLGSLLGRDQFDRLELDEKVPCGFLSFTKWHTVNGAICGKMLLYAFNWRCAMICSSGTSEGVLVIPCIKASKATSGPKKPRMVANVLDGDNLTSDDVFPIYIRLENLANPVPSSKADNAIGSIIKANDRGPRFDEYFGVIFQVRNRESGPRNDKVIVETQIIGGSPRHFLVIPSLDSLTSDQEVFTEAAKTLLRNIGK